MRWYPAHFAAIGSLLVVGVSLGYLSYYGYISLPGLFTNNYPANPTPQAVTTISAIRNGTFPSSYDKQGTAGTIVQVNNLQVLGVTKEVDGDYHIDVTDQKTGTMVTEITPIAYRLLNASIPQVGMTISEIGTPYFDTAHANEVWHGLTGWELHPVFIWKQTGISAPASLAAQRFQFVNETTDES